MVVDHASLSGLGMGTFLGKPVNSPSHELELRVIITRKFGFICQREKKKNIKDGLNPHRVSSYYGFF